MALQRKVQMPEPVTRVLRLLGIVASVRPLTGPYSAAVEVSTKCNFSCLMCPYHSPLTSKAAQPQTEFMDVKLAARVFKSLARIGTRIVNFGHRGEPMLHPDFPGIVRLASREGLQTRVFTNGSMLTERRMKDLIDVGLGTLAVSLVGASPESYVGIHPGASPETFDRLLDSLALLRRLKREAGVNTPKLDLRFIAIARSYQEVDRMLDLGIQLGADAVNLFPFRYRSEGDVGTLAPSRDEEKLAADRLGELAPQAERAGLRINPHEIAVFHRFGPVSLKFPCYAAWVEINVEADGNVTFCVRSRTTVGNVRERSLKDIWLSSEYNRLRRLAIDPSERPRVGKCDCDRCCLFYTNWRITQRLATFGLAPKIEGWKDDFIAVAPPPYTAVEQTGDSLERTLIDSGEVEVSGREDRSGLGWTR